MPSQFVGSTTQIDKCVCACVPRHLVEPVCPTIRTSTNTCAVSVRENHKSDRHKCVQPCRGIWWSTNLSDKIGMKKMLAVSFCVKHKSDRPNFVSVSAVAFGVQPICPTRDRQHICFEHVQMFQDTVTQLTLLLLKNSGTEHCLSNKGPPLTMPTGTPRSLISKHRTP